MKVKFSKIFHSPLLVLLNGIYVLLKWLTIIGPINYYYFERYDRQAPYCVMELWTMSNILLQIIALIFIPPSSIFPFIVAIFGLINVIESLLCDAFVSPSMRRDEEGGYIQIRDRARWVALSFACAIEVILCFAIIYLHIGTTKDAFCADIEDSLTALYYSIVTFASLGYGDIVPKSPDAKKAVISQISFMLLFLGLRLPLAVSVLRVKIKRPTGGRSFNKWRGKT